ncbi:response regulator [bacterium]|nr:response regulator [bacterium]
MRFFQDTSIGIKVLIPPAILMIALVIVSLLAIYGMNKQRVALSAVNDIALDKITLIDEFTVLGEHLQSDVFRISVLRFMNLPKEEIEPHHEHLEQGLSDLNVIYGQILTKWSLDEKEKLILERMKGPMNAFRKQARQAAAVVSDNPSFGVLLVRSSTVPFAEFRNSLTEFLNYQKSKIALTETISNQKARMVSTTIIFVALLITLTGILATVLISTRLISRPIRLMTNLMRQLAEGELSIEVGELERQDELGAMARTVEVFRKNAIEKAQAEEDLKKAKEEADEANRAKSVFLANMSHELRTPLNAILGFSQLMSRSQDISSEQRENLNIIRRSGEHLLTLINDVLTMSKIEAARTTLNENNFDLYRLLGELQEMFQLKADDKGLQFLFERVPEVPQYVRTDEVKLRQVLINLLNNAIKFTEEGKIVLRVHCSVDTQKQSEHPVQSTIHFSVEDTGPGIASDNLGTIFEPFIQIRTDQQSSEGTGLGLPISRQFVQMMGGELTVSSEFGKGSVFKFDVQISMVEAYDVEPEPPKQRVIALQPHQPHYRLLIVDDEQDSRQLLVKLLSPFGFEVREASNGQEAIELLEDWQPHLIWMDLRMPIMDGYEATKRIKATTKGKSTPIIAVTASSFEEEQDVVISAGCDDFLRKPYREEEIFDLMGKHLGLHYVYEDDAQDESDKKTPTLTVSDLSSLPSDLLTNLQEAVIKLDLEATNKIVEQIGESNKSLANALAGLVSDFRFDRLQALIEGVK